MKKLSYLVPVALAFCLASCFKTVGHPAPPPPSVPAYYGGGGFARGYAPGLVAGRKIYVGTVSYTFRTGNVFMYRGSSIRYYKTGRNTARIVDNDDGLVHNITFTSPSTGYTSRGLTVRMY